MPVTSVRVSAAASVDPTLFGVYGEIAPIRERAMPGTVVLQKAVIEAAGKRVGILGRWREAGRRKPLEFTPTTKTTRPGRGRRMRVPAEMRAPYRYSSPFRFEAFGSCRSCS
jgi:hypothetical protein